MSDTFQVEGLPEQDQRMLKRGICPWCGTHTIYPIDDHDECGECGDNFYGTLTIED